MQNYNEAMAMIDKLLEEAHLKKASDMHITVGVEPIFRINGALIKADHFKLKPADTEEMFKSITTAEQQQRFNELGEIDFSYSLSGYGRFRVNAFRQRGTIAIVLRLVAEKVPTLEDLKHPEIMKTLSLKPRGLVLVTGPTGSGKSTTLAAMINLINQTEAAHIITMEDPIEYLHRHNKSIVNQREVNTDSISFANALRAALREDPDVILVGEMRDAETVSTAITAAETGHLVFATLHTSDAAQTIDRIIDTFPPHQQQQVKSQLSMILQGIISQQLLPLKDGSGRIAALEILVATPAIRNLIREGKTHQILSSVQTGAKYGMQTMDMALRDLVQKNLVEFEEALSLASDPDTFMRMVKGNLMMM